MMVVLSLGQKEDKASRPTQPQFIYYLLVHVCMCMLHCVVVCVFLVCALIYADLCP